MLTVKELLFDATVLVAVTNLDAAVRGQIIEISVTCSMLITLQSCACVNEHKKKAQLNRFDHWHLNRVRKASQQASVDESSVSSFAAAYVYYSQMLRKSAKNGERSLC